MLIPFYVVESIYDGYLISLVDRETLLRGEIAKLVEGTGLDQKLVTVYRNGLDHRKTPHTWGPFKRAFLEPVRVGFYATVTLIPFLVLYFRQG